MRQEMHRDRTLKLLQLSRKAQKVATGIADKFCGGFYSKRSRFCLFHLDFTTRLRMIVSVCMTVPIGLTILKVEAPIQEVWRALVAVSHHRTSAVVFAGSGGIGDKTQVPLCPNDLMTFGVLQIVNCLFVSWFAWRSDKQPELVQAHTQQRFESVTPQPREGFARCPAFGVLA